jgi:hypothetical protein
MTSCLLLQGKTARITVDLDETVKPMCEALGHKRTEFLTLYHLCLALQEAAERQAEGKKNQDYEISNLQIKLQETTKREQQLIRSETKVYIHPVQ